ncbi:hypothetical protein, partial [Enterobacter hormaechei]|uniref:hypothetical protein n=1 Tax=Enterobacter hormaechei TaxID=158836 RepID=UPI001F0AA236
MSYYAEDAALVVKSGMVVRGKENIRKAFIAIADYFQHRLVVTQGKMEVIEGGGNALVIMETRMSYYAEDAALVVKSGMVVRGKENIRKAFIAIA